MSLFIQVLHQQLSGLMRHFMSWSRLTQMSCSWKRFKPLTFDLLALVNLQCLASSFILVAPIKKYPFTHRLAKNVDCSTDIALNRSSTLKDLNCLYWYLLDIMLICYIIYFYSILKAQTKWIDTQSKNNPVFNFNSNYTVLKAAVLNFSPIYIYI